MKKVFRVLWSILEVIIIIYVICLTSLLLCKNEHGFTEIGKYTFNNVSLVDERNIHNVKNGDLLIIENSNDIKVGDMIYYYTVYNDKYIIKTNAVVKIESDGYNSLYTLNDEDGITIASTRVLGKRASKYAKWGTVLDILESRIGFLFLVLLPIMIVFIYQVYEFVIIMRYERVALNEREGDERDELAKQKLEKKEVKEDIEVL